MRTRLGSRRRLDHEGTKATEYTKREDREGQVRFVFFMLRVFAPPRVFVVQTPRLPIY